VQLGKCQFEYFTKYAFWLVPILLLYLGNYLAKYAYEPKMS